jgi:multicomponent Na+:H+ antiporter subunit G
MSFVSGALVVILTASGVAFCLLAAVGMVRMPDLYTRMQAASKAATLGAALIIVAAAIYFGTTPIATRALLTSAFLAATAPIAAHVIARVGYLIGVPLADETVIDELRGRYHVQTHELESVPPGEMARGPERGEVL